MRLAPTHSIGAFCNIIGGVASPLLANIYLHYVFDLWVQQWRTKRAHGDVIVVRFCDDFIVGFQYRFDAEQFLAELKERFLKETSLVCSAYGPPEQYLDLNEWFVYRYEPREKSSPTWSGSVSEIEADRIPSEILGIM